MALSPATFEGIRVLDLTRLLPGPYCTMLLADLGATVWKVEEPGRGDWARWIGTPVLDGPAGFGGFFEFLNRGKSSVALDLRRAEGVDAALALAAYADVVVDGFRPGVLDRWGLSEERIRAVRPDAVLVRLTGFGSEGAWATRAGHDINYLARAGVLGESGLAGTPPSLSALQVADLAGGALPAAFGIAAALFRRATSGEGATLDVSMTEGALALFGAQAREQARAGFVARGQDVLAGGAASYGVYETADGRFLALGALEPRFWKVVCEAAELPDLVASGWATDDPTSRRALADVIRARTLDAWCERFEGLDACVEPVVRLEEALATPTFAARAAVVDVDGAPMVVPPTSRGAADLKAAAPRLGEHTRAVLSGAGCADEQIDAWIAAGIAASAD